MKILIIGPGAIGGLFAARLTEGGNDVLLLCNKRDLANAINRDGLHIEGIGGERDVSVKASFVSGKLDFEPELAMVCVKAYSTECVARDLPSQISDNTAVLSLQNGLGNVEMLKATLGDGRILAGTTSHGATVLAPGRIRHAGEGDTIIGETGPHSSDRAARIADVFTASGFNTTVTENTAGLLWGKLLINVGINPLTALLQVKNGALLEIPEAAEIMRDAVLEALQVAQRAGIRIEFPDAVEKVRSVAKLTSANISSMRQDVMKGKRTEIEAICGAVVREGERLGVETPVNRTLLRLVHSLEKMPIV